jgi:ubiquinone/menaquinone biosynthesis C-methylase UbiE
MRNPKILDIGSGHNPKEDAGVCVDKYLDNVSRGKNIIIPNDVKFIEADVCDLPFDDKEFDYVHFHHVIEHVEDVDKALKEIMRVGKKGIISCPTSLWEKLFGRGYHINLVDLEDGKLIIRKKPEGYCSKFGGDELYRECPLFKKKFAENNHLFTIYYEWEDKIEYEIR